MSTSERDADLGTWNFGKPLTRRAGISCRYMHRALCIMPEVNSSMAMYRVAMCIDHNVKVHNIPIARHATSMVVI